MLVLVVQKSALVGLKHSRCQLRVAVGVGRLWVGLRRLVVIKDGGKPRLRVALGWAESFSARISYTTTM